jgi:hypothetical protein
VTLPRSSSLSGANIALTSSGAFAADFYGFPSFKVGTSTYRRNLDAIMVLKNFPPWHIR